VKSHAQAFREWGVRHRGTGYLQRRSVNLAWLAMSFRESTNYSVDPDNHLYTGLPALLAIA
jgi:hypothetical protein